MYLQSDYMIERVHKDAYDRAYREAEKIRALRRAGLIGPNPLAQAVRRGAGALGRLLVTLGQRLQQVEGTFSSSTRLESAKGIMR